MVQSSEVDDEEMFLDLEKEGVYIAIRSIRSSSVDNFVFCKFGMRRRMER